MAKIIVPEGIRRYQREDETGGRYTLPREPRIQVTIGRIEVRPVLEKRSQPRRPIQPALDLPEYLRGRSGRGAE